jgi:hypothetical protein
VRRNMKKRQEEGRTKKVVESEYSVLSNWFSMIGDKTIKRLSILSSIYEHTITKWLVYQ